MVMVTLIALLVDAILKNLAVAFVLYTLHEYETQSILLTVV